jgi:hypothetical protein
MRASTQAKEAAMRAGIASLLGCALMAITAPATRAQDGAAISLTFDPSVRDSGVGGASVANFWSQGEASWANPALLGSVRGIGYDYGSTQLVPSLADDVYFRSERFRIGGFGIGASFSGKPLDRLGFARLDYGTSESIDGATFESFEDIDTWAVGVDLVTCAESLLRATGVRDSDWSCTFDVTATSKTIPAASRATASA